MADIEPQCRDLDMLCPCVRAKAEEFLAQASAAGIPVTIYETLRGIKRQEHYVEIGVSWSMNSKHLPQPPNDLSLAFDAAPTEYLTEPKWCPGGPYWRSLMHISESVGLFNGGRWEQRDYPHNQLAVCGCSVVDALEKTA